MTLIHHHRGVTLPELLIAITILAITTASAAPLMGSLLKSNRLSSAVNDFIATLQFAKNQSSARITPVIICTKKPSLNACTNTGGWEQGWIVYADANNNTLFDTGEMLSAHDSLSSLMTFRGSTGIANQIIYRPTGDTSLITTATLVLCDDRGFAQGRGILVTITGTVSVMTAAETGRTNCL